jgi:hypothetical protein
MGDRLERTEVWQSYHDRVTAEIPVVVSDAERLDMFGRDPMHDDDPAPAARALLRTAVLPEGDEPVML